MGKSLYISRKVEELGCTVITGSRLISATMHGPELSRDNAVNVLSNASSREVDIFPYIYHLEVSEKVSSAIFMNCVYSTIHRGGDC